MGTPGTLAFPAALDDADSLFRSANNAATALTSALAAGATSAEVASTGEFPSSGSFTISDADGPLEIVYYTGKTATTFTGLLRGRDGTLDADRISGLAVERRITNADLQILRDAVLALEAKVGIGADTPASGEFLKGTGAGSSGFAALTSGEVATALGYTPVSPATVDAKGDLLVGTAADALARLAVGADGRFLKAASAQASGLEWAALSSADVVAAMKILTLTQLTHRNPPDETLSDLQNARLTYRGTVASPVTADAKRHQGSAGHFRSYYGESGDSPVGAMHALSAQLLVRGSGHAENEWTPLFTDLSMDARGRGWGSDQNVFGPVAVQAHLLLGQSVFVGNYNSGAIDSGGWGAVITTYPGSGGGDASRATDPAWPLTAGLAIVGRSGTVDGVTLRDGYTTGIQLGGFAGGWLDNTATSRFGTGIDLRDYRLFGIRIHDRISGEVGPALVVASGAGAVGIGTESPNANALLHLVGNFTRHERSVADAEGHEIQLYRSRAGAASLANDVSGNVGLYFTNSAATFVKGATLRAVITDPTAGSEDLTWQLYALRAGAMTQQFGITSVGLPQLFGPTQTTVGAAGAASALPANPTGYMQLQIGGATFVMPYYAQV